MVLINNICYFLFILDYFLKDFMIDLIVNRVLLEISFWSIWFFIRLYEYIYLEIIFLFYGIWI